MSRFKVVRTMLSTKKGALVCFATVQDLELGMEFRDLRVFDGSNGRFLKFPAKTYESGGEEKYMDFVTVIRDKEGEMAEGRQYVAEILSAVNDALDSDVAKPKRPAPKSTYTKPDATPARSSGRGPVGKKLSF